MIQHVYEQALASGADGVWVATDDERVANCTRRFGGQALITSKDHHTGTDRVAEAVDKLGFDPDDTVINLQGDEPLMPPTMIRQIAKDLFLNPDASIASLYEKITDETRLHDPNVIKVIMDKNGYSLYFSRAPIPWHREYFTDDINRLPDDIPYLKRVGMYAYRTSFLINFRHEKICGIECAEALEQLRFLYHGHRVHLTQAHIRHPYGSVDTQSDLDAVRDLIASSFKPG